MIVKMYVASRYENFARKNICLLYTSTSVSSGSSTISYNVTVKINGDVDGIYTDMTGNVTFNTLIFFPARILLPLMPFSLRSFLTVVPWRAAISERVVAAVIVLDHTHAVGKQDAPLPECGRPRHDMGIVARRNFNRNARWERRSRSRS